MTLISGIPDTLFGFMNGSSLFGQLLFCGFDVLLNCDLPAKSSSLSLDEQEFFPVSFIRLSVFSFNKKKGSFIFMLITILKIVIV